jgi:microsomal dipeptidase-like Zn-dependent dipeptidase
MTPLIDGLQYANWSEKIFRQMRAGRVDAVHATITYHETFRETVAVIERWNRWFERFPDLIFQGRTAEDVLRAQATGRTAIFFGSQNPSCIEDDIGLVEVLHTLGLRFMQLTYNNQSLLASGCYEAEDTGLTRMGRAVVAEMNRVGMVIDMSHSGERSTLDAIDHSTRPIAITHANPHDWHPALRNKSDTVLRALGQSGGMLGFSIYPHHLAGRKRLHAHQFLRNDRADRRPDRARKPRDRERPLSGSARFRGHMDAQRTLDQGHRFRRRLGGQPGLSTDARLVQRQPALQHDPAGAGRDGAQRSRDRRDHGGQLAAVLWRGLRAGLGSACP